MSAGGGGTGAVSADERPEVWIARRPEGEVMAEVAAATSCRASSTGALAGLLFAVKNNIDVAGLPTTAGCPAYSYLPDEDAPAVARLREAGAVVVGVTNLDQFATGLVGTRSPYGAVRNAWDESRISGGSSSGSAVAVALGMVDFALGTDTAGSGRVPAALNGIVGIKPTGGLISTRGVVPACATLDVVTVFARDVALAARVTEVMAGGALPPAAPVRTLGIAAPDQLALLSPSWRAAYDGAATWAAERGYEVSEVDIAPLLEAARMLYEGAFVAERYAAVGAFVDAHPDEVDPTVRSIISPAKDVPAWRLFDDQARLREYRVVADGLLRTVDALLLPTTTSHPTLAAVDADPVGVNSRLGVYTNFVNLLGMAAVAFPAGDADGLPFGVQVVGRGGSDRALVDVAARLARPWKPAQGGV